MGDLDGVIGLDPQTEWDAEAWAEAMEPYFEAFDELGTGPDARGPKLLVIDEHPEGAPGTWKVRQVFDDPGTDEIYINNVKTFSQDVNTGPFLLSNLPAITGSGTARVILRDSSGHTTESVLPFYVSANLLAPGMFDYSVEAGLPRLSYGTTGDRYLGTPLASASARYGAFDWLPSWATPKAERPHERQRRRRVRTGRSASRRSRVRRAAPARAPDFKATPPRDEALRRKHQRQLAETFGPTTIWRR